MIRLVDRGRGSSHEHSQNTKAFFSSQHYSQGRNCVFLSLHKSQVPFYYKIHKATLTTGLVKCGVAHPSQATLPSRMPVKSYAPIVCTAVELSTLPGKEWLL